MYIYITKHGISKKKVRKYESHMIYQASFIVIGVKGLFHSDRLGAGPAASLIGPQMGEEERWENPTTPACAICRGKLPPTLAGFLDSSGQNCHVTHTPL
jgi:hypothetical protein